MGAAPAAGLPATRLAGGRLRVHRAVCAAIALAATVGLASLPLPWHEVRDRGVGGALVCTMMPDCDPAVLSGASGPATTDTGLAHGGAVLAALLAALAAVALVAASRPRFWLGIASGGLLLGLLGAAFVVGFDLAHMLESVRVLPAARVFDASSLALLALVPAHAVLQPVLYLGQRRAASEAGGRGA